MFTSSNKCHAEIEVFGILEKSVTMFDFDVNEFNVNDIHSYTMLLEQ